MFKRQSVLRAGAATSNITPFLGISLNGGMADRQAEYVHDELNARCLVLDNGQTQLALVTCDSCMLPTVVLDEAKHLAHSQTGILPENILISATHAHSAPTAAPVFQSDPDLEYLEFLVVRIADGIRRALHNLHPARIGWGFADEPGEVFNRRWQMQAGFDMPNPFGGHDQVRTNPGRTDPNLVEPAGPIDPQVSVLGVQNADGAPLALFANYSLHYVGGVPGNDVSADYFGVFCEYVKSQLKAQDRDPPFVGLLSNGTSGNINNINFRVAGENRAPYEQIRLVAAHVAAAAVTAWNAIDWREQAVLSAVNRRLTLARRLPAMDETARAEFILAQSEGRALTTVEEIYARETVLMSEWPPTIEVPLQALRIGELGIAASPCETFVETGLAIKEQSPLKPTFVVSLANGYAGYLPTPEHHALGGYETWRARSSFLEVGAEPQIRTALLEMLGELNGA